LSGFESAYKIKLRSSGYRLAYEVIDNDVVVMVLAVGKRDRLEVYENAKSRK
jgi:mRNA interferase RelE/StbE